jgi:hypothetical protein
VEQQATQQIQMMLNHHPAKSHLLLVNLQQLPHRRRPYGSTSSTSL